jgi:hypothetical protein
MGICGCSSNKEFRPGQALMYKEDNSIAEGIRNANQGRNPSDPEVVFHPDENIGGMDRIHLPLNIKRIGGTL